MNNIWKELDRLWDSSHMSDEEFVDESDRRVFEWYMSDPTAVITEMANVRGIDVSIEDRLPFSFFYSSKKAVHNQHGIRLKVLWNPSKSPENADGYLVLHGDYEYIRGNKKYKPTSKELSLLKNFAKKYKVLFSAVWESKLYDGDLSDYFKGRISLKELLSKFIDIGEKGYYLLNHCNTIEEIESCVRKNKLFNMND